MAEAHTEATLNKLAKPDLVQLIFNIESNFGSQFPKLTTEVKDLLSNSKKLEAEVAIVRNVNSKLVERVVATEHQCWENAHYSKRNTPEVAGMATSIRGNGLEQKMCDLFQEIDTDICDRDIQARHWLKIKNRTIVKFTNRKDCPRILRVKRQLKDLDPAAVDLPEGTKS